MDKAQTPIQIIYKNKKTSSGRWRDGRILLYISSRLSPKQREEHIKVLTERLLAQKREAQPLPLPPSGVSTDDELAALAARINASHYGFQFKGIAFRTQFSRWGSYSARTGHIYISHRLKNAPLELLEYVIIHEICHTRYLNHGPHFWQLVARACPDHQKRRRLLKAWDLQKAREGG